MEPSIHDRHPLRTFFRESLHDSLSRRIGLKACDDLEGYLTELLVAFLHNERIFALRDADGRRIESLPEMLAEGDVRLNADSFAREREVHRHVGDFLLFWSGLFPEMLTRLHGFLSDEPEVEAARQGSFSYGIVSSFDHAPYTEEAPIFLRLSHEFEACQYGLKLLRASFEGFQRQGWSDGFPA